MLPILIADDDAAVGHALAAVLREGGYDPLIVQSGEEAQSLLSTTAYPIVVTDISMPGMSGLQLLSTITKSSPDTMVLVMTGAPTLETATQALQLGAFDYLMKPIHVRTMLHAVRRAHEVYELRREKRQLAQKNREYQQHLERLVDEKTVALRISEARLAQIIAVAPVGIYLRQHGIILQANPALCAMFGHSAETLIGAHERILHRSMAEHNSTWKLLQQAMAATGTGRLMTLMQHQDGGKRHILLHAARMDDSHGQRDILAVVALDLTDSIKLREDRERSDTALRDAQKMDALGRLAAGVAHEINTPAQFISDNLRFLRDGVADLWKLIEVERPLREAGLQRKDPLALAAQATVESIDLGYLLEEIPKSLDQSLDGLDRITTLVAGLKEFSHPNSGEKIQSDLHHIIEGTLTISRNEWKYVATVTLNFADNLPKITCVPGEISQVLLNIIINASHAIADVAPSPDGTLGLITIATAFDEHWVDIRITDTGPGIPDDIKSRIFEPFFTTKDIGKGTGQGLALAWSVIVDKHGGQLMVESARNVGTTFIIRLPR